MSESAPLRKSEFPCLVKLQHQSYEEGILHYYPLHYTRLPRTLYNANLLSTLNLKWHHNIFLLLNSFIMCWNCHTLSFNQRCKISSACLWYDYHLVIVSILLQTFLIYHLSCSKISWFFLFDNHRLHHICKSLLHYSDSLLAFLPDSNIKRYKHELFVTKNKTK